MTGSGPLLGLGQLTVAEFLVKQVGEIAITFTDESRLVAGPAGDGQAWRLEWPFEGHVGVAARPGGGLLWPTDLPSADVPVPDGPTDATPNLEPIRRGAILDLPIAGLVAESSASMAPIVAIASRCPGGTEPMPTSAASCFSAQSTSAFADNTDTKPYVFMPAAQVAISTPRTAARYVCLTSTVEDFEPTAMRTSSK